MLLTNEDKVIIKHARKSLLYDDSEPWMKKDWIIGCNHGGLRYGRGMPAGRNIPFIQTFSEI